MTALPGEWSKPAKPAACDKLSEPGFWEILKIKKMEFNAAAVVATVAIGANGISPFVSEAV